MSTPSAGSFPVADLLPKKETNASLFLQKYPKYDGRGTVIGILDSGVDPGAPGLQVTSEGKPKIIQLIDATGNGDVDTSTVVKAENGTITGMSGRTLKIPSSWSNPTGEYHIGLKEAFHWFPEDLKKKYIKEWREKYFEPEHRIALADAHGKLNVFKDKHEKDESTNMKVKLEEVELQAANDALTTISKEYKDLGPSWDCVVFHDGKTWQAAIDSSESGDLEQVTLLASYAESFKYATLKDYWLNYSVNIHDAGNLLEIVAVSSSHGTHVAAISAANFSDDPSRNGVAPGAQIVSINIGFKPLGTMEALSSLTRAAIKMSQLGLDVVNMSYGEGWNGGTSPLMNLLDELVNKHGIIYCHAAGNAGTALSTIGAPSSNALVNIGAYISGSMMQVQYSKSKNYEGTPYNFTSRGPSLNGSLGVSVCAPGGAIASVPNYLLSAYELYNGTSMASPNACGCFALILSALKQENILYSPYSVRRAVENTALKPSCYEPFSMGHGLIQVDKAFEHLKNYQNLVERDVDFRSNDHKAGLGIYRRKAKCDAKYQVCHVNMKPFFFNEEENHTEKEIQLNLDLLLQCDKEWVECPSYFQLSHSSRSLEVKLHPSSLACGVHYASIRAYDTTNVEKGPLFHIPVTYVVADSYLESKYYNKSDDVLSYPPSSISPGAVQRIFIKPPPNANRIRVAIKHLSELDVSLKASLVQIPVDDRPLIINKLFSMKGQEKKMFEVNLISESVVEIALSKAWLNIDGDSTFSTEISFARVQVPNNQNIPMHSGNAIHRLKVLSQEPETYVTPAINLKHAHTYLRPVSCKMTQLSERELISHGKQLYENLLTYTFTLPTAVEVKLTLPDFEETLYDAELFSHMTLLYDKNKCFIRASDSYGQKLAKLEKGTYTARTHLWHHSKTLLQKFNNVPLKLTQKLPEECALTLYGTRNEAIARGTKTSSVYLFKGISTPIFVQPPSEENLPKVLLNPGSVLAGSLTLKTKSPSSKTVLSNEFECVLDTTSPAKTASEKESSKMSEEEHVPLLLDLKLTFLDSLDDQGKAALLKEIEETKCGKNQVSSVNICKIKAIEANSVLSSKEKSAKIISLADEVINSVDLVQLLGSLEVTKVQAQVGAVENAEMKKTEKLRDQVMQAYLKKGIALAESLSDEMSSDDKQNVIGSLESIWLNVNNLTKGQPTSSSNLKQTSKFLECFYRAREDKASLLKLLLKMQTELEPTLEVEKKIIELLAQRSEWSHLKRYYEKCLSSKFPKNYLNV